MSKPESGAQAVAEAQRNLEQTQALWPEVRRVAAGLRQIRQQNHFSELISDMLTGRDDT